MLLQLLLGSTVLRFLVYIVARIKVPCLSQDLTFLFLFCFYPVDSNVSFSCLVEDVIWWALFLPIFWLPVTDFSFLRFRFLTQLIWKIRRMEHFLLMKLALLLNNVTSKAIFHAGLQILKCVTKLGGISMGSKWTWVPILSSLILHRKRINRCACKCRKAYYLDLVAYGLDVASI